MLDQIPPLIAAVCLSIYWGWVLIKLVRLSRKIGKDPNALPREPVGIFMRIFLWYPCIFALLMGLWLAATVRRERLARMSAGWLIGWLWAPAPWWWIAAAAAAAVCIVCTVITFVCWRKMGRSWRIGIDPKETLVMVTSGPYRLVRHPIYALRMVINLCAVVLSPTLLVVIAAGLDFVLLQIEARREERYMETSHGEAYRRYKNSVGRFVPRTFVV